MKEHHAIPLDTGVVTVMRHAGELQSVVCELTTFNHVLDNSLLDVSSAEIKDQNAHVAE